MSKDSLSKGAISELYDLLVSNSPENSNCKRNLWSKDMGKEISSEDQGSICTKAHSQSVNTKFKLLQYKQTMRTYITAVKLNKYNSNIPDLRIKCMMEKGTLFHYVWQCSKVKAFWEEIKKKIEKIILKDVLMNPVLFLFQDSTPKITSTQKVNK